MTQFLNRSCQLFLIEEFQITITTDPLHGDYDDIL